MYRQMSATAKLNIHEGADLGVGRSNNRTTKFFTKVSHKNEMDWLYSSSMNRNARRYIRSCHSADVLRVGHRGVLSHAKTSATDTEPQCGCSPFARRAPSLPTPASDPGRCGLPKPARHNPAAQGPQDPPKTATCSTHCLRSCLHIRHVSGPYLGAGPHSEYLAAIFLASVT